MSLEVSNDANGSFYICRDHPNSAMNVRVMFCLKLPIIFGNSNLVAFWGYINYDICKDNTLYDLYDIYDLKNSIDGPTCFKGEPPTLLDVFLANKPNSSCHLMNVDTGISDFHHLRGVVSKVHTPSPTGAWKYIGLWNILIKKNLPDILVMYLFIFFKSLIILMILYGLNSNYYRLLLIFIHASLKQRFTRTNQVPDMNSQLRKVIHQRNVGRNNHFNDKRNSTARNNMYTIVINW